MQKRFIVLVFVLLILSLGPASAVQISEGQNGLEQNKTQEQEYKKVMGNLKEVKSLTNSMQWHRNNINHQWARFHNLRWWQFWKAPGILWEISVSTYHLTADGTKVVAKSSNIKETAEKLQEKSNEGLNAVEETKDLNSQEDAQIMAKELENYFSTSFSISSIGELKEGDIVQYKTKHSYYTYLRFDRIDKNVAIFKGSGDKIVTINTNNINQYINLKLIPNIPVDSSQAVNHAYACKKTAIDLKKAKADQLTDDASYKNTVGIVLISIGSFIIVCGLILCYFGLLWIGSSNIGFGAGLIKTGKDLLDKADELIKQSDELRKQANNELADLDFSSNPMIAENMDLTTKANMQLTSTFNAQNIIGNDLIVEVDNQPQHGKVIVNGESFTYTPDEDFMGNDTFTYKVKDNNGHVSDNAQVNIVVNPGAEDMNLTTKLNKELTATFNATDFSSVQIVDGPTQGNIKVLSDGKFTYTPEKDYLGNDTLTYKVIYNTGEISNIARVNINISLGADDMNLTTKANVPLTNQFNATDFSSVQIIDEPSHGKVNILDDGKFIYTPDEDFVGNDTFTYKVKDNNGHVSNVACVNIVINPGADDMNLFTYVNKDLKSIFSAADFSSVQIVDGPKHGTITINNKCFVYKPESDFDGEDAFTYKVKYTTGQFSNIAGVKITVKKR